MGVIGPIGPMGPIGSDRRWCALLTQRGEHPEVGATDYNPVQRSCAGVEWIPPQDACRRYAPVVLRW